MDKTLAFVIPWYGEKIPGGAESECRSLVHALAAQGSRVEVLTTCVRDFRSDWNDNFHPEGQTCEGGIPVRRFPVRRRDVAAFDEVNRKLMHGYPVTAAEEVIYVKEMINSPKLYDYIDRNSARYIFFFIPYMFGTTYWGSQVCPERSILVPCLHDESYARISLFRGMFRSARGIVFHSPEERELASALYGIGEEQGLVLGEPVDCDWTGDPTRFERRYGLRDFLLYAGRTDQGKNAELLIDYFRRYIRDTGADLKLVFIGGGEVHLAPTDAGRIIRLGYLDEQDKRDCYSAALATCIPSAMESFSLVMMESWVAGTPVLVNAECAVTTGHCRRANGGLWFEAYNDFREIVQELSSKPSLGTVLGRQGSAYVRENFSPAAVAARYVGALQGWFSGASKQSPP